MTKHKTRSIFSNFPDRGYSEETIFEGGKVKKYTRLYKT
jgi:hypothetical protein